MNNMELHRKDSSLDKFDDLEEPEELELDMDEPEMVSMDDPDFDAEDDELEMEEDLNEGCPCCNGGKSPCSHGKDVCGTCGGTGKEASNTTKAMIEGITAEAEVGKIYRGKVMKLADFGAFVNIIPGKDGLVHISQISEERVENVADYLKEGQEVNVNVLDVDPKGRIKLTMKGVEQEA
jgi:cold shock CspA family protein